jgi:hypothetical protein
MYCLNDQFKENQKDQTISNTQLRINTNKNMILQDKINIRQLEIINSIVVQFLLKNKIK